MQQNAQFYIPEPCHEDWNKMTTTQQGRYCQSCCKQVIDFTAMSDAQIIEYLSNTSKKTCGRFNENQLAQPLQSNKVAKKSYWKWIVASIAAFFFFFDKTIAQNKQQCIIKGKVQQTKIDSVPKFMGAPKPIIDTTKTKPYEKMGKIAILPNNKPKSKNKNAPNTDKANKNQ